MSKTVCYFCLICSKIHINLVILKILSKRTHRKTEMPRGDMIFVSTKIVSRIPPHTTKLSNRLKRETKYACRGRRAYLKKNPQSYKIVSRFWHIIVSPTWRPRLYIFNSISPVKSASNTLLAMSEK